MAARKNPGGGRNPLPDDQKTVQAHHLRMLPMERDELNRLVPDGSRNSFIRAAVLAALSKLKRQAKAEEETK